MTLRTKVEVFAGLVLLVLLALTLWQWKEKAVENARAEVKAAADAQASAKLDDALATRQKQYEQDIAVLEEAMRNLKTASSAQIAEKVPQYIPGAQAPVAVTPQQAAAINAAPNAPHVNAGDLIVTEDTSRKTAKEVLDGAKCSLDLAKCNADLGDWQQKEKLATDEAAQWKKAAKGGSVFKRVGKIVMYVGIGAAAGYVAHH